MKKVDLERQLRELGWWKSREGAKHEKWTNGRHTTMIPRHRDINEFTAEAILRFAAEHPRG